MVRQSKEIVLLSLVCCLFPLFLCVSTMAQGETDITLAVERAKDAGVPEEVVSRILVLGYKHGVEASEMIGFIHIMRQAREENLPVDLLVSKIEEGFAKSVHPQIIKRVLQQESSRYRFTRRILYESINRWDMPIENLEDRELVRLSKTLSMGISEQEIERFFARAPKAPIVELVNAVELMAALKQSGLAPDISEEIVFTGLQNQFFSKTPWNLTLMVSAAKRKKISDKEISATVLEIIMGRKHIREAYTNLGLDPQDLVQGSQFSVSDPGAPDKGNGKSTSGEGKGGSSGSGGSGGPSGSGESGGSDGGRGGGKR